MSKAIYSGFVVVGLSHRRQLPMNASGKVIEFALREQAEKRLGS